MSTRPVIAVPPEGVKMLRETLCVAQAAIANSDPAQPRLQEHINRLNHLIDECDRHRPLGRDGKHGDRHTETCGCDDEGVKGSNRAALRSAGPADPA